MKASELINELSYFMDLFGDQEVSVSLKRVGLFKDIKVNIAGVHDPVNGDKDYIVIYS